MARKQGLFRSPRLEALENRCCPTCVVELAGATLTITGDEGDDEIAIYYFGPGALSVECNGTSTLIVDPVEKVDILTGEGNDSVYAELYPFFLDANFPAAWNVDLGAGDDQSDIHLLGFSGVDFPLSMAVAGGDGDDTLTTEVLGFFHARYDQTIDGGNGHDQIANFYTSGGAGDVMTTRTRGGNGDDGIYEEFLAWSIMGEFDGHADGGNGVDNLETRLGVSILFDLALPPALLGFDVLPGGRAAYRVIGGNGHDAITAAYLGRLHGQLNLLADSGNGADQIYADLDVNAESTGELRAAIRGGNGDDHLEVRVRFFETDLIEHPDLPGFFFETLAGYTDTPAPLGELSVATDEGR
jgi:hypothetical protein